MRIETDVSLLVDEYCHLSPASEDELRQSLVAWHDWTHEGATEVVQLAQTKGVFLLRNALA